MLVFLVVVWWCGVFGLSHLVKVEIEYSLFVTFVCLFLALLQTSVFLHVDNEKQEVRFTRYRPPPYFLNHVETIPFSSIVSVKVVWTGQEQLEENRRNEVQVWGHTERSLVQASTVLEILHKVDREQGRRETIEILSFDDFFGWEKNYTKILHEWCTVLSESIAEFERKNPHNKR